MIVSLVSFVIIAATLAMPGSQKRRNEGAMLLAVRVDGVVRLQHEALPWLMKRPESKNVLTTIRDQVRPKYLASQNR